MDGDIQSHQFNERLVITEAKECGEIVRVILASIDGRKFALAEHIAINTSSNVREFGNTVGRVSSNCVSLKEDATTYRSMQSSKTGPQYSFLEIPSWYALANAESWLSFKK